jgi:hypothetical protein
MKLAIGLGMLALLSTPAWAQPDQPDAQRTREEFSRLLQHYPPTLRQVFALDPTLLGNQSYLSLYPAVSSFLSAHPDIAHNPSYYVGRPSEPPTSRTDATMRRIELLGDVLGGLAALTAFAMALGLIIWISRTVVDYRRWNRLAKVQTDVHTKLLDRFTSSEDLLAYIQSPAGAKFLESSPIRLDTGTRSLGAPLGRVLWSVQAGLVLVAAGIGLQAMSWRLPEEAAQPIHALGILGLALGAGFVVSALVSFLISRRLGLVEPASTKGSGPYVS